eukprot:scaffold29703_cov140-Isochrysis_galbana.AAC.2
MKRGSAAGARVPSPLFLARRPDVVQLGQLLWVPAPPIRHRTTTARFHFCFGSSTNHWPPAPRLLLELVLGVPLPVDGARRKDPSRLLAALVHLARGSR